MIANNDLMNKFYDLLGTEVNDIRQDNNNIKNQMDNYTALAGAASMSEVIDSLEVIGGYDENIASYIANAKFLIENGATDIDQYETAEKIISNHVVKVNPLSKVSDLEKMQKVNDERVSQREAVIAGTDFDLDFLVKVIRYSDKLKDDEKISIMARVVYNSCPVAEKIEEIVLENVDDENKDYRLEYELLNKKNLAKLKEIGEHLNSENSHIILSSLYDGEIETYRQMLEVMEKAKATGNEENILGTSITSEQLQKFYLYELKEGFEEIESSIKTIDEVEVVDKDYFGLIEITYENLWDVYAKYEEASLKMNKNNDNEMDTPYKVVFYSKDGYVPGVPTEMSSTDLKNSEGIIDRMKQSGCNHRNRPLILSQEYRNSSAPTLHIERSGDMMATHIVLDSGTIMVLAIGDRHGEIRDRTEDVLSTGLDDILKIKEECKSDPSRVIEKYSHKDLFDKIKKKNGNELK